MPNASQGFLVAAVVVLCVSQAYAETVTVDRKVNLRTGPGQAFSVVGVIPSGTRLIVEKCTDEWCRVRAGRAQGYISRALLTDGADSFASAAPAPALAVEPKATLNGARVWQWRDGDWRDRHWRRIEWHNRLKR